MGITALQKPIGSWCVHCKQGVGCTIYEKRPDECRTFMCMWLFDERLGSEWKPEKSKLVVTTSEEGNGLEVRCDPGFPAAWRKEPYYSQIREWAVAAAPSGGTVLVCIGTREILVAPEGEFPLGDVAPDDRIAREFSGGKLIGVKVIKAADLK